MKTYEEYVLDYQHLTTMFHNSLCYLEKERMLTDIQYANTLHSLTKTYAKALKRLNKWCIRDTGKVLYEVEKDKNTFWKRIKDMFRCSSRYINQYIEMEDRVKELQIRNQRLCMERVLESEERYTLYQDEGFS